MRHILQAVNFLPDGAVSIQYTTPANDVRQNGLVVNHVLLIPDTDQFLDGIELLGRQAERLLNDALDTFDRSAPLDLDQFADEDEAPSPYDNPNDGGSRG